jgi:hypothetical protein
MAMKTIYSLQLLCTRIPCEIQESPDPRYTCDPRIHVKMVWVCSQTPFDPKIPSHEEEEVEIVLSTESQFHALDNEVSMYIDFSKDLHLDKNF